MQLTDKQKSEGWRIVKFGDVAKSVSKRVDPADTDLEVYVGLEHLDPDNLRITRRGVPSDVKGQKLLVKPGQIIFGKRRAYQRKVAVADFEGICSAHAMVLEAIPEAVVPEYLPFFMQSDMFMERAVAISEGSLSPTIKWKTLANQEFPLPPRPRQEEMLEVFEKFFAATKNNNDAIISVERLIKKIIIECFEEGKKHPQEEIGNEKFFKVESGGTPSSSKKEYWNGNINWITLADLPAENMFTEISKSERQITELGLKNSSAKLLPIDTILVSTRATIGRIAIATAETSTNQGYKNIIIKDKSAFLPIYIVMILIAQQRWLEAISAGGTFKEISKKHFCQVKIPRLPLLKQEKFVSTFCELRKQRQTLIDNQNKLKNTGKKFITAILEGAA